MFDSGITAEKLITDIQNEADIAPDIQPESFLSWLNSLEQLLYRDVIKEQNVFVVEKVSNSDVADGIDIESVTKLINEGTESPVRFEDIHAVYYGDIQLIKSTTASGVIFLDTYYKAGNRLMLNPADKELKKLKVVYFARPELKNESNMSEKHVMLPVEFIDLAKAKLRGEAYKIANEGELAATWLNDYNVLLEAFKVWIAESQPAFGM